MIRNRTARLLLASVAALAAAACSESPQLGPSATPRFAASLTAKTSPVMHRGQAQALAQDITRSFTVTQKGSTIEIPETGLKVKVPSNALPAGMSSMTITVTAFGGDQFGYEFEPSGVTFRQPLRFEQEIGNVGLLASLFNRPVVEYFKSRSDIDAVSGTVQTFEDLLTDLDLSGHTVKADVWHFSGYIVAWGRN
jgi:hypothetical protein